MADSNFFSDGSPYLNHPLLTLERTAREVDFVLAQLSLLPGARILDVGCGSGRHSIELARRGYDVVGIDPSSAMIAAARHRAAEAGVSAVFRQASGESFVAESAFDAAICLFTTLGQILKAGDNSALVQQSYDNLHMGGYLVVEVPQRDWVVQHLKEAERFGEGARYTDVARRYDAQALTVTELFEVVSPKSTRSYRLRYRLYSQAELTNLFSAAGFTVLAAYGDYDGNPLGAASAMMLLIGRK